MNMKKIALVALCVAPSLASAAPSATGFYVGVYGGGGNVKLKEYVWDEKGGQKKKDAKEIAVVPGGQCFAGIRIGGGVEFHGVYVGGQISGGFSFLERKLDVNGQSLELKDKNTLATKFGANIVAKPRMSFGGALEIGGVVSDAFVAYVTVGIEGQQYKIQQKAYALGDVGVGVINGIVIANGVAFEVADVSKDDVLNKIFAGYTSGKISAAKTDEISTVVCNFTPGVGVRYTMASGFGIFCEAKAIVGIKRTLDAKYYNTTGDISGAARNLVNLDPGKFLSLDSLGYKLLLKNGVGFQASLGVIYKF
ncbi:MAG: hypothetical protein LBR89_02195 [Holosporales bacterium]|jgi:hypothetical protein|nr:hypothetical protein [Holosporales bacterium]